MKICRLFPGEEPQILAVYAHDTCNNNGSVSIVYVEKQISIICLQNIKKKSMMK
jgi:hypothetical protein